MKKHTTDTKFLNSEKQSWGWNQIQYHGASRAIELTSDWTWLKTTLPELSPITQFSKLFYLVWVGFLVFTFKITERPFSQLTAALSTVLLVIVLDSSIIFSLHFILQLAFFLLWIIKLDHKESWMPKNWCFWTVVLEKTLESPLDCKEIQPVHSKGDQSWKHLEGLMLKLKLQYFGTWWEELTPWKRAWCWKDWRQEKGTTEDEMVSWHLWFNGHGFEQALVMDRETWHAAVHGFVKRWTQLSEWTEL